MDDQTKNTTTSGSGGTAADPREELREQLQLMGKAAQDLLEQLVRVPATLAQIPLQVLPEDTATHARNAASEGFSAVRTLVDSMSRGVDEMIKAQRDRMNAQRSGLGSVGGGDSSASSMSDTDAAGATRSLDAGSMHSGGHGSGAGPSGMGSADSGSRDLGNGGNTIRLDEEP